MKRLTSNLKQRIDNKFRSIIKDVSFNIAKQYDTDDMLIADLLFNFSCLEFDFRGGRERGWLDILIFGETGCGKSNATRKIQQALQRGTVCREKATYAGLAAGIDKNQFGNMAKIGLFPLNDGGSVIIDQLETMPPEEFEKLTDVRSSGIVQVVAIKSITSLARCRKLWIANPRPIGTGAKYAPRFSSVEHPVLLVKQLITTPEDLRRFDIILGFTSPKDNMDEKYRNYHVKHIYKDYLLRRLLDITWAKTAKDIDLLPETVDACYEFANKLKDFYVPDFPMVFPAEQHKRMARFGIALAALTPIRSIERIEVFPEHIEWIYDWLLHLFNNNDLRYADYVKIRTANDKRFVDNRSKIVDKVKSVPEYQKLLFSVVGSTYITYRQLLDSGFSSELTEKILSGFSRMGLLKHSKNGYLKTEQFNELLNTEFRDVIHDINIDDVKFDVGVGL